MTTTNGYATNAQFKERFDVEGTDANRDTEIDAVIQAVSRQIDDYCGRRFWKNSIAEIRYFTAPTAHRVFTDDIVSITALATDEDLSRTYATTWATTDYDLEPYNSTLDGTPYTMIATAPNGAYSFPLRPRAVKITGVFGWNAVPDVVHEACLLQSHRIWTRKAAPFGVAGASEMGNAVVIAKIDPDMQLMLDPLRRVF